MRYCKLRLNDTELVPIDRDVFEETTRKKEPWYPKSFHGEPDGTPRAICPACDNPVQIIGFYKARSDGVRPYGKHTGKAVRGFQHFSPEDYKWCPLAEKRKTLPTGKIKKVSSSGIPEKILAIVIARLDLIVSIISEEIGVQISAQLAQKMLETFIYNEGHLYVGATLQNIPWMFAYMSNAQSLFGQTITNNSLLIERIRERIPHSHISATGKVSKSEMYYALSFCFIHHKRDVVDGEVKESLQFVVSDGNQRNIYRQKIEIPAELMP
jgi:hypothetical protein